MNACKKCGAPMIMMRENAGGWRWICLRCGKTERTEPGDGLVSAMKTAEAAERYLHPLRGRAGTRGAGRSGKYASEKFMEAAVLKIHGAALRWYALLALRGAAYIDGNNGEYPVTFRMLDGEVPSLSDDPAFLDILSKCRSEEEKNWYRKEAGRIDAAADLANRAPAFGRGTAFVCLRTEYGGRPTREKRFGDRLVKLLGEKRQGRPIFYAPLTMNGRKKEEFEPLIRRALSDADSMAVVGASAENLLHPGVRSEWERFLLKNGSSKLVVCCLPGMSLHALPAELQRSEIWSVKAEEEREMEEIPCGIEGILSGN